ncbi:MAG: Ig-like domain-containing protein [Candidatus Lernaella stagnicola]|nr:Ig-like domain-containing protein [Candidatus Lernaella stagnicola]
MKWMKVIMPILALAFLVVACGGGAASMDLNKKAVKLEDKGATAQLSAVFKDKDGNVVDSKNAVKWQTSDATVATVANGTVAAVGTGKATVSAMSGDFTATAAVTVQIPAKVTIAPGVLALKEGAGGAFSAKVLDQKGKLIAGKSPKFSIANSSVASISGGGKVKAKGIGVTGVTATYGGLQATAKVKVTSGKDEAAPPPAKFGKKKVKKAKKPKKFGKKKKKK